MKSSLLTFSFDKGPGETEIYSSPSSGAEWISLEVMAALDAKYLDCRAFGSKCCFLRRNLNMTELVVGSRPFEALRSHPKRLYIYERFEDAWLALKTWDGHSHPSGPWVLCRDVEEGRKAFLANKDFYWAELLRLACFQHGYLQ